MQTAVRSRLVEEVADLALQTRTDLLKQHGVSGLDLAARRFATLASQGLPLSGYKTYSSEARQHYSRAISEYGPEATRVMCRLALLHGCSELLSQPWYAKLPGRIFMNHTALLVRISGTRDCDSHWLAPGNDLFDKEWGIASFRLIATGTRVADVNSGVSRRILLSGGIGNLIRSLKVFSFLGGFSPFLQTHIHDLNMSRITEGGRIQAWLGSAAVIRMLPKLKGLMSASWLEDPALEFATPRLYAANRIVRENGGIYMPMGSDADAVRNALFKSEQRQKLYARGEYRPRRFLMIWPREKILEWSDRWIRENPDHPSIVSSGA